MIGISTKLSAPTCWIHPLQPLSLPNDGMNASTKIAAIHEAEYASHRI